MDDTQRREMARHMGRRVRLGRTLKELSVGALAARVEITPRRLRRIEDGTGRATADELVAVARVLELPVWFLFDVPLTGDATACPACGAR